MSKKIQIQRYTKRVYQHENREWNKSSSEKRHSQNGFIAMMAQQQSTHKNRI